MNLLEKYLKKMTEPENMENKNNCKESVDRIDNIPDMSPIEDINEKPVAAKIYSHILQDIVWLALDPTFTGDGDGIPVYSIEELRLMRGAGEHTMRLLHAIKKIGSQLIAINDTGGMLMDTNKIRRESKCY